MSPKNLMILSIRSLLLALSLFIAVLLVAFWVYFLSIPMIGTSDLNYFLEPGTNSRQVVQTLSQKAQLKYPHLFLLLLRLKQADRRLKSGEYLFPAHSRPLEIMHQLLEGQVVQHKFIIKEGATLRIIIKNLQESPMLTHTLGDQQSFQDLSLKLTQGEYNSLEGLLLPNTYFYVWGMSDVDILKQAYQAMLNYLFEVWDQRKPSLFYKSPYEALIIASMIEKETASESEKPLIASVIINRLERNMRLQLDASVIYGWMQLYPDKSYNRKIFSFNTPYNTYLNIGLPPTPIAMPSIGSIQAALHPLNTSALYYVLQEDGNHRFSEQFSDHLKAVKNYFHWKSIASSVSVR